MYTIENDQLKIMINPAGAELSSIFNKANGLEYLWSGDPNFWAKKSPVLFPIVGTLKENNYFFEGKKYDLGRHGFAREKMFSIKEQSATSVQFELKSDESTLAVFPFQFSFSITYVLKASELAVTYSVKNSSAATLYFSVGGHPAFKLPIAEQLAYDDYFLLFNQTENADRWPIDKDGLIKPDSLPFLQNTDRLPLQKKLFYSDAVVLKNLLSDEVQVKSDKHSAGFSFSFKGFPFLGIWAAKDANFVCIEPWCGIADSEQTTQQLTEKEGIVTLPSREDFERTWSVRIW